MGQADWLRLDEICRLWSEETGLDAASLQTDLEAWFAEFTKESSISQQLSPDSPFDTLVANRLLGMHGARHLERRTFEIYCEERGYTKPRFWLASPDGEREPAGPAQQRFLQDLIESAAAADSEVRELRTQLESTKQRCAALSAENLANRTSSSATQRTRTRRKRRSRAVLAAGLAVPLVALLAWGADTVIRGAGNAPIPYAGEIVPAPSNPLPAGDSGQAVAPANGDSAAGSEFERLRVENARLMDQLAKARASVEALRQAQQLQTDEPSDARLQELSLAATTSSSQVAVLETELGSAHQRIAELERALDAAGLEDETPATQAPEVPEVPASLDPVAGGGQAGADQAQSTVYGVEIEEVLTGAEVSSDPAVSETAALFDVVSSDDLLLDPGHFAGREVVVTAPVVWLLRQYWLRSDGGRETMVIDVEALGPDDRQVLEEAVVKLETLTEVRARITGTIERQGSETYRFAATRLVLVE